MKRYGIPITEHMIFYGDYWRNKGDEAVDWFLSGEEGIPEAIICSNDYMATSVIDALKRRNYRVPEDIKVTGFDNILESRFTVPRMTSIAVPFAGMGIEAVHLLDRLLHGEQVEQNISVPVSINFEGTCGCPVSEANNSSQLLYQEMMYLEHALTQATFMNVDFESCNTIEELITVAYKYTFNFKYDNLYLCLCDHSEDEDKMDGWASYTENMVLRAVLSRVDGAQPCEVPFLRKDLLPEKYMKKNRALYIFPLHYKNNCMGYIAAETREVDTLKQFFTSWIMALSNYLDKIRMYMEHHELMEFRQLSITDELTGLHNRREMEKLLEKRSHEYRMLHQSFYLYSIDMDGLKNINDNYGHLEGDLALCQFSNILKRFISDNFSVARTGGDEFTAILVTEEEADAKKIADQIQYFISEYNRSSNKPYVISASIGFARYDALRGIADCLKRADDNMYALKVTNCLSRSYKGNAVSK